MPANVNGGRVVTTSARSRRDVRNSADAGSFLLRAPCDVKEEKTIGHRERDHPSVLVLFLSLVL